MQVFDWEVFTFFETRKLLSLANLNWYLSAPLAGAALTIIEPARFDTQAVILAFEGTACTPEAFATLVVRSFNSSDTSLAKAAAPKDSHEKHSNIMRPKITRITWKPTNPGSIKHFKLFSPSKLLGLFSA